MNREKLLDREELQEELRKHLRHEVEGLADKLAGVFAEHLLDGRTKNPIAFEHRFVEELHAFGAGVMGRGLEALEPQAKVEVKRGATK
ncbi:MAG: hypothetical protein COY42_34480 [Armatimonadetes bacterium CG_4_10_14_0_8_um_filter_66_14]|nr:hypothetical protein [Armatimonadota bacterium]OIP04455.1 MAG: hypothetical protein AUJ96_12810 [Armatimonadetes bacterium CG2_30_66_41]PIX39596.1 MAG: hypothetical protein COZ57_27955 [Armatimonadetes bacterium CG_4_8_14_3_um_filter_66_20]PIZ30089.1 MAG: hypothetical protein COY42_34480 [Armatimonadetes bacterium CG_4_10_14_0_8_um_filter_66_14]NCP34815.1 hypothetical protein [Armatimonadota bacterium]